MGFIFDIPLSHNLSLSLPSNFSPHLDATPTPAATAAVALGYCYQPNSIWEVTYTRREGAMMVKCRRHIFPSFTLIDCEVVLKLMIKGIKGYGRVRADTHGYIHTHAYISLPLACHWLGEGARL